MRSFLHVVTGLMLLAPLSHAWAAAPEVATAPVASAPVPVAVAVDKAKFEQDIDQLLTVTHVDVDTAFLHDSEKRLIENGKVNGSIPKESWPNLDDALKTAFAADRFKRMTRQTFITQGDAAQVPAQIAWFNSDLGKKFVLACDSVMNFAGEKAMFAYRDDPQAAPPTENRLKLLRRLDAANHGSANEDLLLQNMQKTFVDGFSFYKKNSAVDIEKIIALIAESRAKTVQRTILSNAYILRSFDDAEVEQIIAFLESFAGKNFVAASNQAERMIWVDIHKNHLQLMMGQLIEKLDPP